MTEDFLEKELVNKLEELNWKKIIFRNEEEVLINWKNQLELFNKTKYSSREFKVIQENILSNSTYDIVKKVLEPQLLRRDDDSLHEYKLFNIKDWCQNLYQVGLV